MLLKYDKNIYALHPYVLLWFLCVIYMYIFISLENEGNSLFCKYLGHMCLPLPVIQSQLLRFM